MGLNRVVTIVVVGFVLVAVAARCAYGKSRLNYLTLKPKDATPYYYSQFVDPLIGTGGEGYGIGSTPPGAQVPFGGVRLSPDTVGVDNVFIEWNHFGGYFYNDPYIRLFSHTHMVGSGTLDYGNIGITAVSDPITSYLINDYGYRSSFSHESEVVMPGYYAVTLETHNIRAELTATTFVGVHRYTWLDGSGMPNKYVLINPSHTLGINACNISRVDIDTNANQVTGFVWNDGSLSARFGGFQLFFVAQFNESFDAVGTWTQADQISPGVTSATGNDIGAYVRFVDNVDSVEISVAISYISLEHARSNLAAEFPGNFDATLAEAQAAWEAALSQIEISPEAISAANFERIVVFYTAFYHALLAPTTFSESGGLYVGFDRGVHSLNDTWPGMQAYYSDMSIWDTYRTEFPLLSLLRPDIMSDIAQSLVAMYVQGGDLPRWPLAIGYTGCMIGTHELIVLADAYVKGARNFDIDTAYRGMVEIATTNQPHDGRADLADWLTIGYIGSDHVGGGSASLTLAYAHDDWAVATIAAAIGLMNESEVFLNRSRNFQNIWNPEVKFFCARMSTGEWDCPTIYIDPWDSRYVEGDAWQYRFSAPHAADVMISLFGGVDEFVKELTDFFELSKLDPLNVLPNPYYWAGNEPDIHAVWMFNFAGRPDLTQEYSNYVLLNKFTAEPDGIPGNDDYGTMSAWALFTSLGFFPLAGNTTYMLGSPIFANVTIHLPTNDVVITAYGVSDTNIYVQKAALNGDPLDVALIDHYELMQVSGSTVTLEFWMGDSPSMWGRSDW